jgi:hypothetical protein
VVVTATDRSGCQLRTIVRWAWLGWEGFGDGAVEVLLPEHSRGVELRCPVGLKSCGSMPFAARQTVMSPSSLRLMVLLGSTRAGLPSGSAD